MGQTAQHGVGGETRGRGCDVAPYPRLEAHARAAGAVDLGHELGHVLLTSIFNPVHHVHNQNLMSATGRNEPWTWAMSHTQIVKMRSHLCCQAI